MITIKIFVFNSFQTNTYLLYDETLHAVIIDAACYQEEEKREISQFIESEKITPVKLLNTHLHIDHVLGNAFITAKYGIEPEVHLDGLMLLKAAPEFASAFGIKFNNQNLPTHFIRQGDVICFGNSQLEIVDTPGHADGSICFINHPQKFAIVGDVLFNGSIGRTDFPTGNYEKLIQSIETKLLILPDDYRIYPGHGPATTIGNEKQFNPYLTGIED
jgi:glyoxylase-like metal-dependent hydrolase (beta-lactamase superfamily II)